MTMSEFFEDIHNRFYSDVDISFMEYFITLCDHDDEFFIEHEKLVEYGIMTSEKSDKVLQKLNALGLDAGVHYDIIEHKEGRTISKQYMLTPDAFKLCLMRAQRRTNQPVDPLVYCNYYLLLEKIFKLFMIYESEYLLNQNRILANTVAQQGDQLDGIFEEFDAEEIDDSDDE